MADVVDRIAPFAAPSQPAEAMTDEQLALNVLRRAVEDDAAEGDMPEAAIRTLVNYLDIESFKDRDEERVALECDEAEMEEALAHSRWLAGESFSLADISLTPYVNRLHMLGMSELWKGKRPRVDEWFTRIQARPTFQPCFPDQCPPDLAADLNRFGSQSWPEVKQLLAGAAEA